jgi:hypothetical protein
VADGPTPKQRAELHQIAVATGLGCSIVASIVLTIGGGVLLDRAFDTSPLFTLIGLALGLFAAGYQLYELATMGQKGRRPPPLARGLAKLSAGQQQGDGRGDRPAGDSSGKGPSASQ